MERFIGQMLKEFESGKLNRRQLIETLAVAATAFGMGEAAFAAPPTFGYSTICVNHISYQVSGTDYTKARDFYVKLLGMEAPGNVDSGAQAYLPFGPKEAGTFVLPRGGRDPNAGPAPERAAGGGAAGASGASGASGGGGRGGRGGGRGASGASGAAGAAAVAGAGGDNADAAAGGGRGGAARTPLTVVVDQVGYTVAEFDAKKAEAALKRFGLDPKKDGDSFHIVDPYGLEVQICGPKMSAY